MFQFPGFASKDLCVQSKDDISSRCRVAPFGDLRIRAYLQLPAAYRSLSRPSSPAHAKASTICPSLLNTFEFYTSQVFEGLRPLRSFALGIEAKASIYSARYSIGEYQQVKELGRERPCGVSRIRTGDPLYAKQMLYL